MIYLIGILYILYGFYIILISIKTSYFLSCIWALVSITGGVALLLKQGWAKYVVYLFSTVLIFAIFIMLYDEYKDGVLKFEGGIQDVISILPSFFIVIFCLGSSIVVHKKMKNKNT